MTVTVRPARSGDGAGISRAWLSAAAYYAGLDPEHFQVPEAEGLADGCIQNRRRTSMKTVPVIPDGPACRQHHRRFADGITGGRPAL